MTLDTTRPCNRFHADHVVGRLLCTYVWKGTLWLPEGAFDPGVAERSGTRKEDHGPGAATGAVARRRAQRQGSLRPVYHRSPDESADSLILKVDLVQI